MFLTMRQTVDRYLMRHVYRLEDLLWRNKDKKETCMHKGCMSPPAAGKAYCRKHLHGGR